MSQDPTHFLLSRNAQLPGVIRDALDTDENVPLNESFFFTLVEGNNVGIVIVLQVVAVDLEHVFIRTENIIQFPDSLPFALGLAFEPLPGRDLLGQFIGIILIKKTDHRANNAVRDALDNPELGETQQQRFFTRLLKLNNGFALGTININRFYGAKAEFRVFNLHTGA